MASPNPEARLNVALKQVEYARGILAELLEELWQAGDDPNAGPETARFLLDELQTSLSRTEIHVVGYFQAREATEETPNGIFLAARAVVDAYERNQEMGPARTESEMSFFSTDAKHAVEALKAWVVHAEGEKSGDEE